MDFFIVYGMNMTQEEQLILNELLHQDIEYFYPRAITFLILISQYMRFARLSRRESIRLQSLGVNILDIFQHKNKGCPVFFAGIPVSSLTTLESSPPGGPGFERPIDISHIDSLPFGMCGGSIEMNIHGTI